MKKIVLSLLLAAVFPSANASLEERIVKVHTVQQSYSVTRPWTRNSAKDISGTGFVYKAGYVLTNAHVVRFARQVYIQPYQSSLKVEAEVVYTAPGIDLAIIRPLDDTFSDFEPIEIDATIPKVASTVNIYGYPVGGDELSITEGVISRIEVATYNETISGLRIQVDAAINSGNSGGPAFVDDKLAGIVFSRIREADNIGYVIPTEEVSLFLSDIEDGNYDGKWLFPYHLSKLQNRNIRENYELSNEMGGLLVSNVLDSNLGTEGLQSQDVLLKIGEHDIDRTGNVKIRNDLRLGLQYLIPKLADNRYLPVTLLRNGQRKSTRIKLSKDLNRLLPYQGSKQPEYFIYGPFPFTVISQEFVLGMPKNLKQSLSDRGYEPLYRRLEQRNQAGQQLITCPSKMFAHPMTKGVSDPIYSVLKRLNGNEIVNLEHLVRILSDLKPSDFAVFEFDTVDHTKTNTIVLKHSEVLKSMENILSDNGIRKPFSSNFNDLWTAY